MSRKHCRACGSDRIRQIFDFGPQPLAGEYPSEPESVSQAKRYNLDLTECEDCGLWQVTKLPPITEIFHNQYKYSTSTIPDMVRHFTAYSDFLSARMAPGASILEFGCNDGVLLSLLQDRGFHCVGIDASDNVASLARAKGLDVHTGFITPELVTAKGLNGCFDQVTCSNVFAHIDDIELATRAVKMLLKPGGVFNIEVHDGKVLADEAQFDTVYHEHLTYFTEGTLRSFLQRQGFEFQECTRLQMHGGGIRLTARNQGGGYGYSITTATPSEDTDVVKLDAQRFSETISRCRADIKRLYDKYGPIDGYGAAGRAQMFINMTSTAQYFRRVYDDSPFRQGRYIIGTNIPIVPFLPEQGACCAILAWNYAPAISRRIGHYFSKVVTLLPKLMEWEHR